MATLKRILFISVCLCVRYMTYACPNGCSCPTTSTSVSCRNMALFPNTSFPQNMTTLELHYSRGLIIPAYGFHGYANLKSIKIYQGSVDRINSDAFGKLSIQRIDIDYVDINRVDGNAFRNLNGNMNFNVYFRYGKIEVIDSYAFNGIRGMWDIQFYKMNIKEIRPYAFNDISLCYALLIQYSTITHLRGYAFNFPDNGIKNTRIDYSTIINIGCKTVDKFTLTSLTTMCDCGLASLYKIGVGISGNPVECLNPESQPDAVPYAMFECERPEIPIPGKEPASGCAGGWGKRCTDDPSFMEFLHRLHTLSRNKW